MLFIRFLSSAVFQEYLSGLEALVEDLSPVRKLLYFVRFVYVDFLLHDETLIFVSL